MFKEPLPSHGLIQEGGGGVGTRCRRIFFGGDGEGKGGGVMVGC